MRKCFVKIFLNFITILMVLITFGTAFAHSGGTDSNGGHRDKQNQSGLGSYHYHCNGYPAHLHTDGYCPYRDVFPSSVSVSANKTTLEIGESVDVTAAVSPANACDTCVSWSCSNPDVISLSDGVITALGYGTATISVASFNNKVGDLIITVEEMADIAPTANEVIDTYETGVHLPAYVSIIVICCLAGIVGLLLYRKKKNRGRK